MADEEAVVRAALPAPLTSAFKCVGTAAEASATIVLLEAEHPDILILDIDMPSGDPLQSVHAIRASCPEAGIVILSSDELDGDVVRLGSAGAAAYLRKQTGPEDPTGAITAHKYLPPAPTVDH